MSNSKVKLKHSFKTVLAYESISLKRDPAILAVVLLTPALMALVLYWLLFYILNANLIASEVALPVYLPLEKLNLSLEQFRLSTSHVSPVLFYYSPATERAERLAFEVIDSISIYNKDLLARRSIKDVAGFYSSLTEAHYPMLYKAFDSPEEMSKYFSLPIFHSTNCSYKSYDAATLEDLIAQHAALNCTGTMIVTPDTYARYELTEEYVQEHPPELFQPALFALDFSEVDAGGDVIIYYNSTLFSQLKDPLTNYLAKDFYSTTGTVFYLAVQRAVYISNVYGDTGLRQGTSSSLYNLPLLTSVPVPERIIPQIYPSQSGTFITVLSVIALSVVSTTFAARDRGKGHSTLRLLGVSEGVYWFIRWLSTVVISFFSSILLVLTCYCSQILPLAGFTLGFLFLLALLLTLHTVGFSLFLSALLGRSGIIIPLVASLLIGILCGAVVTATFRLTYNTGSVFDPTIMPSPLTWILSLLFPSFNIQHIFDFMMLVLHDSLRGKFVSITKSTRRDPTSLLTCGMKCYTDPEYANSVYLGELVGAKQSALDSSVTDFSLRTYTVPSAATFCIILAIQCVAYTLLAVALGYSLSEPMYRGINLIKVLHQSLRYKRYRRKHMGIVSSNTSSGVSVACQNLRVVYGFGRRKLVAVDNFTFIARKGSILALLGTNGAGKSSVMAVFAGEKAPTKTSEPVLINDYDMRSDYEALLARGYIGKCPQHNQNVFESFTVLDNIYLCSLYRGALDTASTLMEHNQSKIGSEHVIDSLSPAIADDEIQNHVIGINNRLELFSSYVAMLNLDGSALRKRAEALSGGMRRRLSLLNATIGLCDGVVFMDEVSTGLDPLTCRSLHDYIRYVANQQRNTVILTTHNMADVEALASGVVLMKHGVTVAQGTVDEICSVLDCYNITLYASSVISSRPGPVIAHPCFPQQCKEVSHKVSVQIAKLMPDLDHSCVDLVLNSRTLYTFRLSGKAMPYLPSISQYLNSIIGCFDAISSFSVETATLDDAFVELAADKDATEYSSSAPVTLYKSNAKHLHPRVSYSDVSSRVTIEDVREEDLKSLVSAKSSFWQTVAAGLLRLCILEFRMLKFGFLPSVMIFFAAAIAVVAISKGLTVSLGSFVDSSMQTLLEKQKVETLMECLSCCNPLYRDAVISGLTAAGQSDLAQNDTYVDGIVFISCSATRPSGCFSDSTDSFYVPSSCQSFLMLHGWDVMNPRTRSTGITALWPYFTNNEVPHYLVASNEPLVEAMLYASSQNALAELSTYTTFSPTCLEFLQVCANGCGVAAALLDLEASKLYNTTLCQEICDEIGYGTALADGSDDSQKREYTSPYTGVCSSMKVRPGVVLDQLLRIEDIFLKNLQLQKTNPIFNYLDLQAQSTTYPLTEERNRAYYIHLAHEKYAQQSPFLFFNWTPGGLTTYGIFPDTAGGDYSYSSMEAQVHLPYGLAQNMSLYSKKLAGLYPNDTDFMQLANVTEPTGNEYLRMRGFQSQNDFTSLLSTAFPDRYLPEPVNVYTSIVSLVLHTRFENQRTNSINNATEYVLKDQSVPFFSSTVQAMPYVADTSINFFGAQLISSISFLLLPPVFMAPILYVSISILREQESRMANMLKLHSINKEMQVFTIIIYYLAASLLSAILAVVVGLILNISSFRKTWGYMASMLVGLSYSSAVIGAWIARILRDPKVAAFVACCFILICFMISVFLTDINLICIIISPLYFLVFLQKGTILASLSKSWLDFVIGFFITTTQLVIVLSKSWLGYVDGVPELSVADPKAEALDVSTSTTNVAVRTSLEDVGSGSTLTQLTTGLSNMDKPYPSLYESHLMDADVALETLFQAHSTDEIKLHVANLSHHYGKQHVLKQVGLNIRNGEISGLVGLSGSGKTTLINCLADIVVPDTGTALLRHASGITDLLSTGKTPGSAKLSAPLSLIPQDDLLYPGLTIMDHLRLFAPLYGYKHSGMYVNGLLTTLSLFAHRHKRIRELSGGMRRRASLIIALLGCRHILCLDEFTTGLSINIKRAVWQSVLAVITDMQLSVILTSHDMHELEFFCMNVSVLHKGSMVYSGETRRLGCDSKNDTRKHFTPASQCIIQLRCIEKEAPRLLHLFFQQFGSNIRGTSMSEKKHSTDKEEAVLLCIRISLTSSSSLTDVLNILCTTLSPYKWLIGFSKLEDSFLHTVSADAIDLPTVKQTCSTE
ncbi:ABC transporter, ATP-binding protein [Giardia lamblia P15]|uniref:ABC transporter, ATP-binding protein n=1 Tax=Giardia intestinalis (strain P15) TaxID=658858 RepID=E1F1D5_GIAIA|nr:ABC transporter, ATP-binding protein [Giardia lamblia P15]